MLNRLVEYFSKTLELTKMQFDLMISYWDVSLLIVFVFVLAYILFLKFVK